MTKKRKSHRKLFSLIAVVAIIVIVPLALSLRSKAITTPSKNVKSTSAVKPPVTHAAVATPAPVNYCASNTLGQDILVSISARHLWACSMNQELYNSAVITGISLHPDTITPVGTYAIYGKITNTTLTGSDSTGSWSDPVHYWMPFLHNQYGSYGLHDATWRSPSDFGNISPNSPDASQGCVELPLATAAWIFNWANIGTTVTITN